jgi:hypothetical protein
MRRDSKSRSRIENLREVHRVHLVFEPSCFFLCNVTVHRAAANDVDFRIRAARGSVCNGLLHPVSPSRWVTTTEHDGENYNRSAFNPEVNYVRESVYSNGPYTIRVDASLRRSLQDAIECGFAFL